MRHFIRTSALVALAALVAAVATFAASGQPPSPTSHLVVAVLRNDGLLLPFAAFDGRKWSAPWPSSVDRYSGDLPVNLASVPRGWWGGEPPGAWTLWPRNGDPSRALALQTPVMIRVGISRQLGFRTDQPPVLPPVPPFVLPFPKVGVALAGDARVAPIASVSAMSPTWKVFADALRPEIAKAEERSISALNGSARWRHPFNREARRRVQSELEAWYVTPLAGSARRLSYIEAIKKYPVLPEDDGCGLETYVSGWVHHDEGQTNLRARLRAVITYCDRRRVSYMLPFGQLEVAGKTHWIVQMSGRDHEWYAIVEGRPDEVKYVAEFQAGRVLFE
jgi:hypothetical protein